MKIRKLVLSVLLLVLSAKVHAQLTFTTNNGAITITGYTGNPTILTIPSTTNGYLVTSIGFEAFANKYSLTNITFPGSITNVGNGAFVSCTSLKALYFQGNAPSLGGADLFFGDNFNNPTVYYLAETTGWGATLNSAPTVPSDLNYTTNADNTVTITSYTGPGGAVIIPNTISNLTVTSIETNAFEGSGLVSVTIPGSIITIGDWAFNGCQSLTNVTMSYGVTNIGNYAFFDCISLAGITIPNSVTNLGLESFAICENLNSVTFGNDLSSIGQDEFRDCFSLTNVIIPNNVTSLGDGAFSVCKSLTNATIGSGVTNIEGNPFLDCQNLMAITVDNNNPAFSSVEGVLFNHSQTFLDEFPAGRTGTYQIPNSVTLIAGGAFDYCFSLTGVFIPNNVTNIIGAAFANCHGLTNVTIPAGVTFIGGGVFANCTNLGYVFFEGNAPATTGPMPVFSGLASNAMGYYLPGKKDWSSTYSGLPTVQWNPQVPTGDGSFGVLAHQFGFNITGNANIPIVVEACTNLNSGAWVQLQSITLTNSPFYFTDPQWTNYPGRFYRIRSP
jgi:hypothetical protein